MKGSTILKGIAILLAAVFLIHQGISALYTPLKTENAVFDTVEDSLAVTGVIIRTEALVKSNDSGTMHFVIPDGSRVSKDGVIANIYDNANASITVSEISATEKKIKDINDILSYNDIEAANIDLINSKLNEKTDQMIYSLSAGDYSSGTEVTEQLFLAHNRRQAALGNTTDFASQLEALNTRLNTLSADLPTPKGQIFAAESGYFVSKIDGYEQVFTGKDLAQITPEFLDEAKALNTEDGVIGKIVSDYEWYIAADISVNESLSFKEGQELKLKTTIKTAPELYVTVKMINVSENSDKAVVLFACNQMNSELASMRSGPMTVVKVEYSGLKIPRKALRVVETENGVKRGVYVLSGMQVHFVPVEIVHSNESVIICKKQTENDNALKLYDPVVVKGKNLYDGKIVG